MKIINMTQLEIAAEEKRQKRLEEERAIWKAQQEKEQAEQEKRDAEMQNIMRKVAERDQEKQRQERKEAEEREVEAIREKYRRGAGAHDPELQDEIHKAWGCMLADINGQVGDI